MLRSRRVGISTAPTYLVAAVVGIGVVVSIGAGCRSSQHGVAENGDAATDRGGDGSEQGSSATGGGGGGSATGGGTGTQGHGGATGDAASGTDATTGDGGGAGAIDAMADGLGAGCNTLATGTPVTITCAPDGGAPAAPTGGTIVPGTYVLTAVTAYGECAALAVAQTSVITGNTVQTVVDDPLDGVSRVNATYVIAGTNLVQTGTCPTGTSTFGFSVATAAGVTTLTLISAGTSTTTVGVLTKQ